MLSSINKILSDREALFSVGFENSFTVIDEIGRRTIN